MDAQDSSISKQSPEIRLDVSSEEMVTDQATQNMSSEDMSHMTTDQACQDRRKMIEEYHERESSGGMQTHGASSDNHKTARDRLPRPVVNKEHRSLFEAAMKGEWEKIEKSLNDAAKTAKVLEMGSDRLTMLDVAIIAAQDQFVENLVEHLLPNCKDPDLERAFCYAAGGGRMRMVKALINKIDDKPETFHSALVFAVQYAPNQKEVIWYMARHLKSTPPSDAMALLIVAGHLDICLYLARKYQDSVKFEESEEGFSFLGILATMTHYFRSAARLNFWEKSIYKFIPLCLVDMSRDDFKDTKMTRALNRFKILLWNLLAVPAPFIKRSGELKLRNYCSLELAKRALPEREENTDTIERVVLDAASRGAYEIVKLCLERFPELMWDNYFATDLIERIIMHRHVELFRLMKTYKPIQCMADDNHSIKCDLVGAAVTEWSPRCVSPDVSGAAFLMQRELQWFQVVEDDSYASFKWVKVHIDRKTHWEEFVEQRKDLLKEAGQWMKDTSSSCSIVATLIITIAFAAAFTVPGGNDNSTGIPIFLRSRSFMAFAVADALALFCSVTATLMFLAILTSRYAIEDFHHSLPRKMVLGLTFLFLSLAFMLAAFGSALSIVLSERLKWIYIPITLLASFPVVLFALLQLPLYIEMVESTFRPHLYRPMKLRK